MKKFLIRAKPGRNTVQLTGNRYLSREAALAEGKDGRGTQPIYFGSFSKNLDPERLSGVMAVRVGDDSCGIRLLAERLVDGQQFELNEHDVRKIRDWLLEHGHHVRREQERTRNQAERDAAAAAQRLQIEREVQLEFRESIRAELLEELRPSSAIPAIHAAMKALAWAARAVEFAANALKSDGRKVISRRAKSAAPDSSEVGQLLEATLRLRRDAFAAFERSCQTAGLMATKSGSKTRNPAS